jgi:DnaK suppressor protein
VWEGGIVPVEELKAAEPEVKSVPKKAPVKKAPVKKAAAKKAPVKKVER